MYTYTYIYTNTHTHTHTHTGHAIRRSSSGKDGKEDVATIDAHTTLASTADAPASHGANSQKSCEKSCLCSDFIKCIC